MSTPVANPGLQKAAILMVLLGEEAASHIYRNLPENDVQRLTRRIAELEHFKPETAIAVLEEYHQLSLTQSYLAEGGPDYAQKLLVKSFGEAGAQRLLDQVTSTMEQNAVHLESLQEADPQQLAKFLEVEHPQTIALILAHLNARQASTLLLRLPEDVRAETIKRLAQLRQFSPEVAQKVALALNKHLESVGEQSRRAYAGFKGAADLLNQIEPIKSKSILEIIEKDDPKMALAIRNLMFTFEDLLGVPEAGIRELLGQLDKKTLALALRGATEELKNLIFKSMSSRAVDMLKEDMEVLGAVRAKDVNQAQHEIVEVARRLEAEGKLVSERRIAGGVCRLARPSGSSSPEPSPCSPMPMLAGFRAARPIPASRARTKAAVSRRRPSSRGAKARNSNCAPNSTRRSPNIAPRSAALFRSSPLERQNYYRRIEGEVVELALAIARKILHREVQIDPHALAGIVRVTLEKLDTGHQGQSASSPQGSDRLAALLCLPD